MYNTLTEALTIDIIWEGKISSRWNLRNIHWLFVNLFFIVLLSLKRGSQ